jgi:hypothetical protein
MLQLLMRFPPYMVLSLNTLAITRLGAFGPQLLLRVVRILATVARNPQPVSGVPEEAQGRRGRYSKNLKGTIQAKACHISFYPPLWTQLLETAKAEMWHALFRQHPFLPDK